MISYCSTGDIARIAGVTQMTATKWADAGLLQADVSDGGTRRVSRESLDIVIYAKQQLVEMGIDPSGRAIGAALRLLQQPEFPPLDGGSFIRGYMTAVGGSSK